MGESREKGQGTEAEASSKIEKAWAEAMSQFFIDAGNAFAPPSEPPVTIPIASETRRSTAVCSHLDMAGESAIENYDGIPWCFICGARIEG
jgi:hypothetical protein